TSDTSPQWTAVRSAVEGQGAPLDAATRSDMEPRFGVDFGAVRVHTGERARSATEAIGALAFTLGRHIVLGAPSAGAAVGGRPAPPGLAGTVFRQVPAHDRGLAGEQGMGFAGYASPTWALVEGPSGAAG